MRVPALAFISASLICQAQDPALLAHWAYETKAPLDIQSHHQEKRGDVVVHEISYASPKGGRVPSILVVPRGKGPFPAVVWGHWYWENSAFRNRKQFLEEAVLLAKQGVVSLLTDGPVARPGYTIERKPMNPQQFTDMVQQVVDMRRGVDLLAARKDVDIRRIAFVGHSYNASVGGVLSGVERRFKAFVLMAGGLSDEVDLKTERFIQYRQRVGPETWDKFVTDHVWADAGRYVAHAAPATVFMQFANQEDFLTPDLAREHAKVVSEPKRVAFYEAPHALNAKARRDRIEFLAQQLGFRPPGARDIAKVTDLEQPPQPKR